MSNELKYKLYNPGDCIPEQTMFDYIDNKLSPKEQHQVEKHMLDCELCADAVEGLRITKNRQRIAEINQAVKERIATADKKIIDIDIDFRLVMSIAAGILLLIGGVFFFKQFNSSQEKNSMAELKTVPSKDLNNLSDSTAPLSPPIASESAPVEEPQDFSFKKDKLKPVNSEQQRKQYDQGLLENEAAGAGKGAAVVSDELSTSETDAVTAPDEDLKSKPANGTASGNTNTTWTIAAAPAAADKDVYKNNDANNSIKTDDASKAEEQDIIVLSKQQTASKRDANRAEKTTAKKKEESKEAEKKPELAANSGYSNIEQSNDQTIVLDSEGRTNEREQIYSVVDEMPTFPGGEMEMLNYLRKNITYSEADKKSGFAGKIYIRFTVDKNGNIREPKIFKGSGCCPQLDKEVLRVVSNMPQWNPGKLKGTPVNVLYTLPVAIELR